MSIRTAFNLPRHACAVAIRRTAKEISNSSIVPSPYHVHSGSKRHGTAICFAALTCLWCLPSTAADDVETEPRDVAQRILAQAGISGGLIVHLNCGQGRLTASLRAGDGYLVHGLDTNADEVARARAYIGSLGKYGSVSVDTFDGRILPYADNVVNLLVAKDLGDVSVAEVMRVLCPGGVACVQENGTWSKTVKPRPQEYGLGA